MWVLVFFQLINNNVTYYELGQFLNQEECLEHKAEAAVLVTTSNVALYCFEVIDGQD
jgi:hypothetical protein